MFLIMMPFLLVGYLFFSKISNEFLKDKWLKFALAINLVTVIIYVTPSYNTFFITKKMILESITYFVVIPIIVAAISKGRYRFLFWDYRLKKVLVSFKIPFTAALLFYCFFAIYHYPFIYISEGLVIHALFQFILVCCSFFMWFPIVNKMEEYKTIESLHKILLLFVNGLLLFITFIPTFIMKDHLPLWGDFSKAIFCSLIIQEIMICFWFWYLISGTNVNEIDKIDFKAMYEKK